MASVETIPALRRAITELQAQGYSLRVALRAYRAAGGRARTEDFAAIWRDERRKAEKGAA